ncbi:MAG: aspartyl protease family protein [Candidatus Cybelea sp.]
MKFVGCFLLFFVAAFSSRSGGALASPPTCDARLVLAQMRTAMGGAEWNEIGELAASGSATVAGLHGTAQFDDDLTGGRYARRFRIAVMGPSAEIYDGTTVWAHDISGGVHPHDSPYARREAVTNAYLARRGYFDQRSGATVTCFGTQVEGNRSETAIRVEPRGGIAADLTIDAQTHLLTSVSLRAPLERSVVTYADYRMVDGVVLPFSISSGTTADPADDYAFAVSRYVLRPRAASGDFARPIASKDARMLGGATSATVPMTLEGRQLIVWASINGRPSMPFILDTGGHAILTKLAAESLGLLSSGAGKSGGSGAGTISTAYTRVKSVRIGAAELLDQPFLIIPYPYSFYERGKRTPLAGIIGLEFFERYATRLDYGDRTVTFTPLAAFHYRGGGAAVSFTFESDPDEPMVNAAADGHRGLFGVDTGNAGDVILFGHFLKQTGLAARYSGGARVIGSGTGGSNTGHLETLRRFTIGDRDLHDIEAYFTQMKSGAFAAWTQAGNMGLSILSRFIPTFDYAAQRVYLDPENRETPLLKNRSGIAFEKNEPGAFDVLLVKPNSAAAQVGIVAGDRIVAVNGKDASNYSRADLLDIVTKPAGTKVRLRVLHAGAPKDVSITLH